MPLQLETVPCLSDNYAFLIHNPDTGKTAVVDVPEVAPLQAALEKNGWTLSDILLTHHHADHIDGVDELRASSGAAVWGARADQHRLPALDHVVDPETPVTILGESAQIIDVPGHTVGHIAFYFPESGLLFSGDSLMALGCGRLFEGTPDQMWSSLQKMAALPDATIVCSGHEYTQANANFAKTVDGQNKALMSRIEDIDASRANGQPTVPSELGLEKATNPFLRASSIEVKTGLGMENSTDAEVFAEVRRRKDSF